MPFLVNEVWPAPAKVNLFLHVTGRRADGYHVLQTVFQFLEYGDTLRFKVRDDGVIERVTDLPGVPEADDLTVRAGRLLQRVSNTTLGASIGIQKRLPLGGGLGGGSSNAATTLVALNSLWALGLSTDELADIGLSLGADVPVFVRGKSAWAEGIGEILTPVELEEAWFLVITPPCNVSTALIFSDPELTRDHPPITIRGFLAGNGRNDCEPVTRRRYPPVEEVFQWLAQHGVARMSGTGASVFVTFATQAEAEAVYNTLPQGWQGFVAQGKNESALRRLMDSIEAPDKA